MAVGCAGAALVAAGCGLTSSKTTTVTTTLTRTVTHTVTSSASGGATPCTAHDFSASFKAVPGSAGAGNIVYALTVTNQSQGTCTVSGIPQITFLDENGNAITSHVSPNGAGTAVLVTLQPGNSATANVRFSPDVDPCEPGTAKTLNVAFPGNSILAVTINPATKLCGGGSLQPTPFSAS